MAKNEAKVRFTAETGEFTAGIKSMNQDLSGLKASLKLNKAEMDGNGKSVDLLQQRHELLAQELTAVESKVELTSRKLDKAKEIFGENSDEAKRWTKELTYAKIQQQNIANELSSTSRELEAAEQATDEYADALDEASDSAEDAAEGFTIVGGALADQLSGAIDIAKDKLVELATSASEANATFQAQTGASTESMEEFSAVIQDIYGQNWGESLTDVAEAMAQVKQQTGEVDPSKLEQLTINALTLRDTFDFEVSESMRAVNQLMTQFGIDAETAFDLVADGAQNGLNKNDNLLDTINEYGPKFQDMGLSAEDMFAMLKSGAEAGVFDIDKLGDAVNEFSIRVKDGTADNAFKELGLDVDATTAAFGQGGDAAKKALQDTMTALANVQDPLEQNQIGVELFGTMWEDTGGQAILAMGNINDAASEVQGTMDELANAKYSDIGSQFSGIGRIIQTDFLQPLVDTALPGVQNFLADVTTALTSANIGGNLLQVGTDAALGLINGLASGLSRNIPVFLTQALPMLAAFSEELKVNAGQLIDAGLNLVLQLGQGIANSIPVLVENVPTIVTNIADIINENAPKLLITAGTLILTLAQGLVNAIPTIVANVPKIIQAIVSVITAFNWLNLGKSVVTGIANGIKNMPETLKGITKSAVDKIKTTFSGGGIKNVVSNVFSGVKSVMSNSMTSAKNTVSNILNSIKNAFSDKLNGAKNIVKSSIDKIKGLFKFSWSLPKLRVPKVSITWSGSPIKLPHFHVKWNAQGAVLQQPTIFGRLGNTFLGGGEAGPEAIAPIDVLQGYVSDAVAAAFDRSVNRIASAMEAYADRPISVVVNGREMMTITAPDADTIYGRRQVLKDRGLAL